MRILHAIQELRAGGAEQVVLALVRATRDAGNAVAVVAAPGRLESELGDLVHPLPLVERKIWRIPGAAIALDRAIRSWRPDLIHVHNPGMAAVAALATARGRRPPGLVTVHGVPDADYRKAARLLRLAGLPAVACGPGVAAGLAEHHLRVPYTIVNGITPPPLPASRARLCSDWGVPPGRPLVISVGRLVALKNHALAIEALRDVPEATLALVGDGPLHAELVAWAEHNGVRERVVFAGYRPDARALLGAADAAVLPSLSEGLPLAALEALAAGTPLIATRIRGIRELVDDSAALLVPPDDPGALAGALRGVLGDEHLRRRLSEAGRTLAARYTEEAMVERYFQLYATLFGT